MGMDLTDIAVLVAVGLFGLCSAAIIVYAIRSAPVEIQADVNTWSERLNAPVRPFLMGLFGVAFIGAFFLKIVSVEAFLGPFGTMLGWFFATRDKEKQIAAAVAEVKNKIPPEVTDADIRRAKVPDAHFSLKLPPIWVIRACIRELIMEESRMADYTQQLVDLAAKYSVDIPEIAGVITSQQATIQKLNDQLAALAGIDPVKLQAAIDVLVGQEKQLAAAKPIEKP